jgi:hypothetical protein
VDQWSPGLEESRVKTTTTLRRKSMAACCRRLLVFFHLINKVSGESVSSRGKVRVINYLQISHLSLLDWIM